MHCIKKHLTAKKVLKEFHKRLVGIRVLDPACGTGNFLYVTLDQNSRIIGMPPQVFGIVTIALGTVSYLIWSFATKQWPFDTRPTKELPA